jgi:hypothetical protein
MGLAYSYHAREQNNEACEYAEQLLALVNSHPFFKTHPMVQDWREAFRSWGCELDG